MQRVDLSQEQEPRMRRESAPVSRSSLIQGGGEKSTVATAEQRPFNWLTPAVLPALVASEWSPTRMRRTRYKARGTTWLSSRSATMRKETGLNWVVACDGKFLEVIEGLNGIATSIFELSPWHLLRQLPPDQSPTHHTLTGSVRRR